MDIIAELKRRNVFRVAIAYGVIAWVLAQIADLAFDNFGAPEWVSKSVLFILLLGFPLAVFFAWAFEMTPEGIKKEKDVDRDESITPQTGRKLNHVIIGVLVLAVGFLVFERMQSDAPDTGDEVVVTDTSKMSIAVLPFENRSNRDEDEYFTEGIHDDLLTTMANIGSMKVISRTSVMEYRDTTKKIPEIAKELGVANILEGGIQRSGNQVRINVQLIDAETDEHLWAEIYDRELTAQNLFKIQSEVSQAIATALKATLSPDEAQRINAVPTNNLEAYEAYLLGRQRWTARTADSTAESVELFLKAIELDPDYAAAWAGLGDAYRHQVPYGGLSGNEMFPKAERAILKALELDPDLAEAHAAYGGYLRQTDGNRDLSVMHLNRALELNPSYSPAYNWLALHFQNEGSFHEAIEILERGMEIDPLSAVMQGNLAFNVAATGQDEEMRERLERLSETHPDFPQTYAMLGFYNVYSRGRPDDAVPWMLRAVAVDPRSPIARINVSRILHNLGDAPAADRWLQSALELQQGNLEAQAYQVRMIAERGQADEATALAQHLYDNYPSSRGNSELLIVLTQADFSSGNAESALQRYASEYPEVVGPERKPITIFNWDVAIDIIRLLRATGSDERADDLLAELTGALEDRPAVRLFGSAPLLSMAYALAGRDEDALVSLREGVDKGWRADWRFYLDYHWAFESLRDRAEFQSIRMDVAADMEKQLENLHRMERSGELPGIPGMDLLTPPERTGAPPI